MSTWPERVLLACYEFPPSAGIGARRWAKLAKGLAEGGSEVRVLAAEPNARDGISQWSADVEHPRIRVTWLPRIYPRAVSHPSPSLHGRIAYRLALRKLRRWTSGTPYDTALGWDSHFLTAAKSLLREEPADALVATGAPFHLLYLAARIKQLHPGMRLLVDYRDPWLDAVNYGMADLDDSRRAAEQKKQRVVLQAADVVTAPNEFLLDRIRASDQGGSGAYPQFAVLPHFFDPADRSGEPPPAPDPSGPVHLVYGGALYLGLASLWPGVLDALDCLERDRPDVYRRVRIDIYSDATGAYPTLDRHMSKLRFRPSIGPAILDAIHEAAATLLLLAPHNCDFLTTKFFEYLPCRRPFIVIGPRGHVADFVEHNRLGVVIEDPASELPKVLMALASGDLPLDSDYDVGAHTLDAATRRLAALLQPH